jgi:hypothetical protein
MVGKLTKIDQTYQSIKTVLETARNTAYRAVNFTMVQAYWHIGRLIVEEEQKGKRRAEYGKYLIKELSQRLNQDFGKGFDRSNIWHMRKFYLAFPIIDATRHQFLHTHEKSNQSSKSSLRPIRHALRDQSLDQTTDIRSEISFTHYRLLLKNV